MLDCRLLLVVCVYFVILVTAFAVLLLNWLQYKRLAKAKEVSYGFKTWLYGITCIVPSMYISFLVLVTYKSLVGLILSIKHGTKFGGLLKGQDAWYAYNYPKVVVIPSVLFIKFDNKSENIYEVVKEFICTSLESKVNDKTKLRGTIWHSLGYYYILKDEIKIENCIKRFKLTANKILKKSEFIQLVESYAQEPLSRNNRSFWEVSIGTQPVKWDVDDEDETDVYPIVVKFSHCLADGVNLYKAIWKIFGDTKSLPILSSSKSISIERKWSFLSIIKAINEFTHLLMIPILLVNELIMQAQPNALIGPKLSNNKIFCVSEDHSTKYLSIVKDIKKNLPFNTSITNIVTTAFNASLAEFYQKYTSHIPTHVSYSITETPESVSLISITPDHLRNQKVTCTNMVGLMILNSPTLVNSNTEIIPVMDMLKKNTDQKNVIQQLQESQEYFKVFGGLFSVLPIQLVRYFMNKQASTAILTNLPGPPLLTMNGILVKHLTLWCPHVSITGVSLALTTYGGKLEMTLSIDRNLVSERSQVQEIMNGIYKHIDLLHTLSCNKKKQQ